MSLKVNIKKRLGNFNLDVAFETERGVFAILGASGCGKSMTLKCIAGIETPDEGRIELNGRILYDSAKKINLTPQKRRVGYMFQDYALFPNMTVEQNIKAGMGKHPEEEKVRSYINRFRLEGMEKHYPAQLSGGQKQRVAMARMIASEPDILLLDEPFSALDSYLKWRRSKNTDCFLSLIHMPFKILLPCLISGYKRCFRLLHRNQKSVVKTVIVKLGHSGKIGLVFFTLKKFL